MRVRVSGERCASTGDRVLILARRKGVVAGLFGRKRATGVLDRFGDLVRSIIELGPRCDRQDLAFAHVARDDQPGFDVETSGRLGDRAFQILWRAHQRGERFRITRGKRFSGRIAGRGQTVVDVRLRDDYQLAKVCLLLQLISNGLSSLYAELLVGALERRDHDSVASLLILSNEW